MHVKCECLEDRLEKKKRRLPSSNSLDNKKSKVENLLNPCHCGRGSQCICCERDAKEQSAMKRVKMDVGRGREGLFKGIDMRFNSQLNEANTNGLQLYKEVNNGMMRGRVDYTSPRINNKADRYMDETANLKRLSGLNGDFNFFQTEYNDINRLQNELVNSNILPEPTPRRDNNIHPVDMNSGFSLPAFNTLFSSMDFVQGSEKDFRAQKSSGDFGFASGVYPPNPIRFYDCCSTKKLGISQGAGDDFSSYTKQYKYYPLTNKPQVHLSISSCELSNGCCCTRGTCSSNKDSRCAGKTHNSNPYNGSAASQCGCSCSQNKSSKLKSVKDADGAINCGCGCKKPIMECTDCVKDMCEEALLCPTI